MKEDRVEKAISLFKNGYNCAQCVFAAYADLYGIDEQTALRMSAAFGGGIGGMRETCGTVSGMVMLAGLNESAYDPRDKECKKRYYETVQLLVEEFRQENGSIVCKELLGLKDGLPPGKKKKPCIEHIRMCACIVDKYIIQNK